MENWHSLRGTPFNSSIYFPICRFKLANKIVIQICYYNISYIKVKNPPVRRFFSSSLGNDNSTDQNVTINVICLPY